MKYQANTIAYGAEKLGVAPSPPSFAVVMESLADAEACIRELRTMAQGAAERILGHAPSLALPAAALRADP